MRAGRCVRRPNRRPRVAAFQRCVLVEPQRAADELNAVVDDEPGLQALAMPAHGTDAAAIAIVSW
jgi:hypothetical protein